MSEAHRGQIRWASYYLFSAERTVLKGNCMVCLLAFSVKLRGDSVSESWFLRCLSALTVIAICGVVAAQQRPIDYLYIQNSSPQPIWVSIRPHGDNAKWDRELKIDGQTPDQSAMGKVPAAKIALHDGEPFDISIRQSDGEIFFAKKVMLCTMMRICEGGGQQDWKITGRTGRWITDTSSNNHQQHYIEDQNDIELDGHANQNSFTIPYFQLVGKKPDDPNPPPPPPKRSQSFQSFPPIESYPDNGPSYNEVGIAKEGMF